jgi:hypothetical protein
MERTLHRVFQTQEVSVTEMIPMQMISVSSVPTPLSPVGVYGPSSPYEEWPGNSKHVPPRMRAASPCVEEIELKTDAPAAVFFNELEPLSLVSEYHTLFQF